jgi:hypothetical protein
MGCQAPASQDAIPVEDTAAAVPAWHGAVPIVLPPGTVLRCAVAEDLSVRTARVGDVVALIATERIVLDGVEVILPGTHLQARVSRVTRPRTSLQSPELSLDVMTIETPSGSLRDCPSRTIHMKLQSDRRGLAAGTLLDVFLSAPVEIPTMEHQL